MKKGFSHGVAPDLINERPGMKSLQVAELALSRNLCSSDSKTPALSLGQTLAKEVREGRLPEVVARKVGGVLCYYPATSNGAETPTIVKPPSVNRDETVSIRLGSDTVELIDQMVEVGKFGTRSEALAWLVGEGIANNEELLEKVMTAVKQIRSIKASV